MMKAYINIKNNSGLHLHQTLNKRIGLMKRESRCNATHHFSFGEPFDETMMKGYFNGSQIVRLSNHQFIGFSPLIKSAGKATEVNIAIRRLVRRTSGLPTDRRKPMSLAKRKWRPISPTSSPIPPQAFGKQKAIAH
ncbi:MAG TPA: hypothetical protein K8V47_00835 [Candidatus Amulumruptor caecigallinarius]|jgi:hypothetical protein|uniref:Uncharacterized protein n=1 Tax=Candidatus Amulumruptor caecigallinarius TaxID=2109911 RepID=A0A921E6P3_9BACT|nr:hypothetical protein [Candidatus Amulumruptor caecigallinarius]